MSLDLLHDPTRHLVEVKVPGQLKEPDYQAFIRPQSFACTLPKPTLSRPPITCPPLSIPYAFRPAPPA